MKNLAAILFTIMLSSPAFAADLRSEIMNAAEHAEYSGEAATLEEAHMHLHHSLNCIVGPNGKGFDAHSLNPCVNSGNGIIPDVTDPAMITKFQDAADKCREALASHDLAHVKDEAVATAKIIVATLKTAK